MGEWWKAARTGESSGILVNAVISSPPIRGPRERTQKRLLSDVFFLPFLFSDVSAVSRTVLKRSIFNLAESTHRQFFIWPLSIRFAQSVSRIWFAAAHMQQICGKIRRDRTITLAYNDFMTFLRSTNICFSSTYLLERKKKDYLHWLIEKKSRM